jgi:lipoprotein-releasing system ATP-binding protein
MGASRLEVLRGIDLEIRQGEAVCIVGSSGAGKSTLLHILGTLDRPTLGKVIFRGVDLSRESDEALAEFRNRAMGFVFQFHHLMSEFTAIENVMMPCRIGGLSLKESREKAEQLLELLGLKERLTHYPSELSGGEQQRVAIARALVKDPVVLLADEPTGELDSRTGDEIYRILRRVQSQRQTTLVVVTHDRRFITANDQILEICDGRLASDPEAQPSRDMAGVR